MVKKGSSYFWPEIEGVSPVWVVYKVQTLGSRKWLTCMNQPGGIRLSVSYQEGEAGRSQVPGLFWATEWVQGQLWHLTKTKFQNRKDWAGSIYNSIGSIPKDLPHKPGMVSHSYNSSIWEVEARRLEVQGHSWLYSNLRGQPGVYEILSQKKKIYKLRLWYYGYWNYHLQKIKCIK